ncbi:hypothetical protein EAH79_06525 [Sphingomonas koreensis]|nr:hypothetical protein EAH79_06525 [Sphingomonas koreensis]
MDHSDKTIDPKALDSLAVTPPDPQADCGDGRDPRQSAGQDESIAQRLERDPENKDARLDAALDESMDASDPPASTQPVHNTEPAPSSGYDEDAERERNSSKD